MKKHHIATAVLVVLCSTAVFAAPRNESQPSPFSRALDRIVRVIKHVIQPLDDIGVSPPHP